MPQYDDLPQQFHRALVASQADAAGTLRNVAARAGNLNTAAPPPPPPSGLVAAVDDLSNVQQRLAAVADRLDTILVCVTGTEVQNKLGLAGVVEAAPPLLELLQRRLRHAHELCGTLEEQASRLSDAVG